MDNLSYILFICIEVPLILMLLITDRKQRTGLAFFAIGLFLCLFISEVNSLLLQIFGGDLAYVTTTVTPITEEIIKAVPVLLFAFFISDDSKTIISISMAVGFGFAIMENLILLVLNVENVTLLWAFIRAFSSGLMHGVCTSFVGMGITLVRKKRKLFITGTAALLISAIIYHAIFNMLIQFEYKNAGMLLPLATYIPIIIISLRRNRKAEAKTEE